MSVYEKENELQPTRATGPRNSDIHLKMLLPSILVRRLDFKRASCQKNGVVQILKVEQDSRQIEKDLSIVWGDGEGPTETFNRRLGVAFDSPEVGNLVVNLD